MAAARQEQAEIQGRHHFERRYGDDPSQTPSFSSLVARHEISQGTAEAPPQRPLLPTLPENQPQLPRRGRPNSFPVTQVRIADYNCRKLTALQLPLYTPVYDDESSVESSGEDG